MQVILVFIVCILSLLRKSKLWVCKCNEGEGCYCVTLPCADTPLSCVVHALVVRPPYMSLAHGLIIVFQRYFVGYTMLA